MERNYESESETESIQSHWLDSESETETSPDTRDSGFRVRDEGLGKFCCRCNEHCIALNYHVTYKRQQPKNLNKHT